MAEKTIKTRFQMKRGTSAEWALATGFKPLEGEPIFYSDLNKTKIGRYRDGTTNEQKKSANHQDYLIPLSELPFSDARDADTLDGKHASEFALSSHGTHVTAVTVKSALGTSSGTTKYLREDGTWVVPPNTDTGATSVEVTGAGNAITTASYDATTRKLTLKKDVTFATKTELNTLISSGTADPTASTASQYYFKYN